MKAELDRFTRLVWVRYGASVLAVGLALALDLLFPALLERTPFALFYGAVALAAWFGGLGPGLLAGALAIVAVAYFIFPPLNTFNVSTVTEAIQLLIFGVISVLISALTAARQRAEEAAQLKARQQAAIAELSRHALDQGDLGTLMNEAVSLVASTLNVEYAEILELQPSGKKLLLRAGVGWKPGLVGQATVESGKDSQAGYTLASKGPVIVRDLRTEQRFNGPPLLREHKVVSGISVIVPGQDHPFGVFGAHTTRLRVFSADEVYFLQSVANVVATAIERKRQHDEIAFQAHMLGAVEQAVIATDTDGVIIYWNPFAEKLYGWAAIEVLGRRIQNITPTDVSRERMNEIVERLRRGENWSGEFEAQRRDGSTFAAFINETPIVDAAGNVVGIVGLSQDITQRKRAQRRLSTQFAVTKTLAEATSLREAMGGVLREICETFYWEAGAFWAPDPDTNLLRCQDFWHQPSLRFDEFEALTREITFALGVGLPGRVWQNSEAAWISDVIHDPNFPRASAAARNGLHAAFAFPIRLADQMLGIVEFFSREIRQRDDDFLEMMSTIGSQAGQFIKLKTAEDTLRESEARKTSILEAALDAIITMDHQGEIVEFNPAAEQMFGFTRDEVLGKAMAGLIIPPQYREQHRRGLEHYLATGEQVVLGKRLELSAVRRDGTEFPVELAITRIASDGAPIFTGHIRDITARKSVEAALRASEERFRALIENSSDAIAVLGADGKLNYLSPSTERMLGYGAEMLGRDPAEFMHPDDRDSIIGLLNDLIPRFGETVVAQYRVKHKDGAYRWIESTIHNLLAEPTTRALVFNYRDITDRRMAEEALRASEERYRGIVETAREGIWITDAEGKTTFANETMAQMFGYSVEELISKPLVTFTDEEGRAILEENAERRRQGLAEKNDLKFVRKDGTSLWTIASTTPLREGDGRETGMLAMLTDITDRKRTEEQLQRSNEQLEIILKGITDGITVQEPSGKLIYANDAAARIIGYPSAQELLAAPLTEVMQKFEVMDEFGHPFALTHLPGRLALQGLEAPEALLRFRVRGSTEERWSVVNAAPVRDESGRVQFAINIFRDFTERKRAEDAVREQSELLRVTLSSIGDAVISTDTRGAITFMNAVAESLTGWTQQEAEGKPLSTIFRIINERTRDPMENPASRVLREQIVVGLENHSVLIRKDGTETSIDDSAAPIRDNEGKIVGVVLVFRDITERRQRDQDLSRLAAIVSSSEDAIIGKTLQGIITSWNRGAERLYGYTADEIVGKSVSLIFPPEGMDEHLQILDKLRRGEAVEHLETVRMRKDGSRLDVSVSISPTRDASGRITGAATIGRDITARKRAEEAERFLAEASTLLASSLEYETTLARVAQLAVPHIADWCSVYIVAEDGTPQQLAVAHVDPEKVKWAHELQRRFPPDPNAPGGVTHVLRSGEPQLVSEITEEMLVAAAPDEERLEILHQLGLKSVMIVPLNIRGHILGAITMVSAESGRRFGPADLALAQELARRAAIAVDNARLYREAQAAIRVRDQFLSIASHELKTPLTSLMGYTELLKRRFEPGDELTERDIKSLNIIGEQAARLNRLVITLLDLSRLQGGQLTIEHAAVDVTALVRRLAQEVQPTLAKHTLDVQTPEEPLVVEGDELRLEQVLQNLIQNAVKYSPVGGPIQIQVGREDSAAVIAVSDRGIGIPASELPQLFSRFYRARNVESLHITGLGLGLHVVKEIVSLHGGTVDVQSREGEGSTFTVRLPLFVGGDGSELSGDGKQ